MNSAKSWAPFLRIVKVKLQFSVNSSEMKTTTSTPPTPPPTMMMIHCDRLNFIRTITSKGNSLQLNFLLDHVLAKISKFNWQQKFSEWLFKSRPDAWVGLSHYIWHHFCSFRHAIAYLLLIILSDGRRRVKPNGRANDNRTIDHRPGFGMTIVWLSNSNLLRTKKNAIRRQK